jgi:hypothetical protein
VAGVFDQQRDQAVAAIVEQFRRSHRAGHENGVLRQIACAAAVLFAGQLALQPPRKILEVVQPFAQKRIAHARDAQTGFVLDALDRRFRREARAHRIAQASAASPDHARTGDRLRSPPGFRRSDRVRRIEHGIDGAAQAAERLCPAASSACGSSAIMVLDLHARLVQHDRPMATPSDNPSPMNVSGRSIRSSGSSSS